jgi:hypothetical protein
MGLPKKLTEQHAPSEHHITDYDRRHLPTYLRLLDAESQGASWRDAAKLVLHIDPAIDYPRAKRLHSSHLDRAHWLVSNGYRELLQDDRQ